MTFDDELMANYIPQNVQIDIQLSETKNLEMFILKKKDEDLVAIANNAKEYYEGVVRKINWENMGRRCGVLFKVPLILPDSSIVPKYYLHIFGDYEIEEEPITPLKMLRTYVRERTNSPKIFWYDVGRAYGLHSDRIPVKVQ
jgi:hypothetical protein